MTEEAFTKEFALESGFGGAEKSPEDQRLAAFEARAAQEVEALTKVTLKGAFETDRWNGAITRGGRLDVVKGSVRDEVFRVLGEDVKPTDNSAESRLWKYDYPENTLQALEDRKYSAEQVAIQPLEGFATILRSLEKQSQRSINAEVARLKEIEVHEATLRHLQDNFDGDKGIQKASWGWNPLKAWHNRGVRKDVARIEDQVGIFAKAFDEIQIDIRRFQTLKNEDLKQQTEAFNYEKERLKSPEDKALLWQGIQIELTSKSDIASNGPLVRLMPDFNDNTTHADRVRIFTELGYDQSKTLEAAELAQKQQDNTLGEALADKAWVEDLKVDYEDCVKQLTNAGAQKLESDVSISLDTLVPTMLKAVREAGITILDDQSMPNEQKLLALLAAAKTKPTIFQALDIATKDQLFTWLQRTNEATNPNREVSDEAREARKITEAQIGKVKKLTKGYSDLNFSRKLNAETILTELEKVKTNQGESWEVFLVHFETDTQIVEEMKGLNPAERTEIEALWKSLKEVVETIQTAISGWETSIDTLRKNEQTETKLDTQFAKKNKPKDRKPIEIPAPMGPRDPRISYMFEQNKRIENDNLERQETWKAEKTKAYAELEANKPEFKKLKVDGLTAKLESMAKKTAFKAPRRANDIPTPSQRLNKYLKAPALATIEARWTEQLKASQQAQFQTLKKLPEGMEVAFAFSDMLRFTAPSLANAQDPNVSRIPKARILDQGEGYVTLETNDKILVVTDYNGTRSNVGIYYKNSIPNHKKGEPLTREQMPTKPNASGISLAMTQPFKSVGPSSDRIPAFGIEGGGISDADLLAQTYVA